MMVRDDSWHAPRTLLAWVVAGVFLVAAIYKIIDPAEFAQQIRYYKMPLLPLWAVNGLALLLPWWELAAVLALLAPNWRRVGAAFIFVMLCVFIVAIGSAVARGLDISCGCFGKGSGKAGVMTLTLDLALLVTTAAILWYRPKPPGAVEMEAEALPTS